MIQYDGNCQKAKESVKKINEITNTIKKLYEEGIGEQETKNGVIAILLATCDLSNTIKNAFKNDKDKDNDFNNFIITRCSVLKEVGEEILSFFVDSMLNKFEGENNE